MTLFYISIAGKDSNETDERKNRISYTFAFVAIVANAKEEKKEKWKGRVSVQCRRLLGGAIEKVEKGRATCSFLFFPPSHSFPSFFAYDREKIGFHAILLPRGREKKKGIVIPRRVAFAGSAQQRTRRRLVCPAWWITEDSARVINRVEPCTSPSRRFVEFLDVERYK